MIRYCLLCGLCVCHMLPWSMVYGTRLMCCDVDEANAHDLRMNCGAGELGRRG